MDSLDPGRDPVDSWWGEYKKKPPPFLEAAFQKAGRVLVMGYQIFNKLIQGFV
ncbi:MAG: hypothetical protein RLZ10_211 [Bacteroidota bacterium]|jgi:hypothetical protein